VRAPGIAVLPFADMSAARDQEYFCDGIAEEVLTALAQVDGLRVIARTSAFAFKGRPVDVRTIGRTLDVDVVLEGSVRRYGDRMRITVQLVSAADGNHLWAGRYDRSAGDLFEIQDEIASTIAQQLRDHLAPELLAGVVRTRRADLEVHQLFLKGRYFLNRRHPGDHQRAITCFEEALARDSGHAPSAVAIGDAFIVLGTWGLVPPDAVLSNARAAVERALTIDDTLADGHLALAFIAMWYRRDRRMAEREFHRGFELGLRHPVAHEWYASYLLDQGRDAEALAQAHQGLLMDPLSPTVHTVASVVHLTVGRIEEAQAMLRHALELDQGLPTAHHLLGWSWLAAGRDDLAEPLLRRGAEAGFTNSMALLAVLHARVGQSKRAVAVLDDFDQRAASRWIPSFDRAIVHAALGDEAQSFALVDEALARGEPVRIMTLGQFMSGLLPDAWLSEVKRRASAPMPEMPGRVPT
jgi:serine/threonine-protein kinase